MVQELTLRTVKFMLITLKYLVRTSQRLYYIVILSKKIKFCQIIAPLLFENTGKRKRFYIKPPPFIRNISL
jgi:hypothetical protein